MDNPPPTTSNPLVVLAWGIPALAVVILAVVVFLDKRAKTYRSDLKAEYDPQIEELTRRLNGQAERITKLEHQSKEARAYLMKASNCAARMGPNGEEVLQLIGLAANSLDS